MILHRYLGTFLLCLTSFLSSAQENWQTGDIIFRTGTETVSDLVMLADDSGYSHVGILINSPQGWEVLHATPEELPGQGNKVVLDTLDFFIAPERLLRHRVFHVKATTEQREKAVQWAMAQLGQPFTLIDPEGLYCTTLIWKAWRNSDVDLEANFTIVKFPLLGHNELLLPSGLIRSPLISPASY